jgi:membrane protein YdbS with pleckstrin-like domain
MRYRVFGEDAESGERMEIVLEADSIADAEKKAAQRSLTARRVEIEDGSPPATKREPIDTDDTGFEDMGPMRTKTELVSRMPATDDEGEHTLWSGGPSQWVNFWKYSVAILVMAALLAGAVLIPKQFTDKPGPYWPAILVAIALPLLYGGFVCLRTAVVNISVSSERLQERNGILMRTMEEIELFRVKDMQQTQSLVQRVVGLGTLTLFTSDTTRPTMVLNSIRGHRELHDVLRKQVERLRKERGVREFDMNDAG